MDERLPKGWVSAKLGDVVFPGDTRHPNKSAEPDFLYVDIEALNNSLQKIVAPKKIPSNEAPGRARLVIHTNDVIFSLTRPYLKNIAIVSPELDDQIASTAYCVMRPEKGVSSHFIFYLVTRDDFINSIVTYGDSPPAARDDEFLAMKISLAPTNEQHRIVAAIEQQFTRLDNAITSLQSAKARAKQYRASLLKAAVEGELTKEWRAEHPVEETGTQLLARILAERCARWEEGQLAKMHEKGIPPKDEKWKQAYKEPQRPNVEQLPILPEGWCWATVEQLASPEPRSIQSGPFGSSLLHSEFQKVGILAIGIDNVLDGSFSMGNQHRISPEKYEQLKKYTARPLDVLITVMATVGRCCVVPADLEPAIITKHVYRISINQMIISPLFLMLCFWGGSEVRRQLFTQVQGQTRPGINGEILRRIAIPVPSLSEQAQIVAEVEAGLSNITQMEETIETSLKRAEHERQSILREAFAGRLVLQDQEDEPASVLLEHIREERKKREEAEKTNKEERKMVTAQQHKKRKNVAPLYDVLVEMGGELAPEELYQRSDNQRKNMPEEERDEGFYIELDAEVTAFLIREDRPALDKVLLHALEQDNDETKEGEEQEEIAFPLTEMR